jgi:sulfur carrier protein
MFVTVNGERRELPDGTTVSTIVEELSSSPGGRGMAVAVDDEVLPRGAWATSILADGARVEIVVAVQGG